VFHLVGGFVGALGWLCTGYRLAINKPCWRFDVASVCPCGGLKLAAEALTLERTLRDLVNQAYALTPTEIALVWQTAPPRMPIPRPAG
jgi:hypothetical protein